MPWTAARIREWLIGRIAAEAGSTPDEVDVDEPFSGLGLGSREAIVISGELEEALGVQLDPTLLYDHPTIAALASHLAGETPALRAVAAAPREREPIAIVGIGCRFPGCASPRAFFDLLCRGGDAVSEVPPDRWDLEELYDPDPAAPGKMSTRWAGLLEGVDRFDAHFFGISPREAEHMDPQQRILLQVAWEALEDAGHPLERLRSTDVGVFVGISTNDYGRIQAGNDESISAYTGTGNAMSIAANRLSYVLDLHGPSLSVDTACSSSLVAVHLACQSLWLGECSMALVGGVNLVLSPDITINFSKAGLMAPDGRCKAFDAAADGYVRGEGAGVVLLKPLSRALAEADHVYAVILGSAVNHDGRTNGMIAPSRPAQEDLLRQAYRQAGVPPGLVQYVEAHGTGTSLGDQIEAGALGAVLAGDRPAGRVCGLGSVKSNIGHLEAAAGIAGLIKVALAIEHGQIPPSLHVRTPNPQIRFDELPLRVQDALGPWPEPGERRLASVSSFGFGGTNAHVVLAERPDLPASVLPPPSWGRFGVGGRSEQAHLLPISARSRPALEALAASYVSALGSSELEDVCATAGARRTHHDHRLAVVGRSPDEVAGALAGWLRGEAPAPVVAGHRAGMPPAAAFAFSGQGGQWHGMGRLLHEVEPAFRDALERCAQAMLPHLGWDLVERLLAEPAAPDADAVDVVQPSLFAVQVALAALWRAWGIEPGAVIGHSMGEVAAAHVAGVLSLEDAALVICERSRALRRRAGHGGMALVGLGAEAARGALAGREDRVAVAAINSPTSTVLSGEAGALAGVLDELRRQGVFCREVSVDVASHSPQVEPLREELLRRLEGVSPGEARVPMVSTVTGDWIDGRELDAAYWVRNLRDPVLFMPGLERLLDARHDAVVEVGPHPVLLASIRECIDGHGQPAVALPSLRHHEDERESILSSLAALYARGAAVDWSQLHPGARPPVPLPAYPWQERRHWFPAQQHAAAGRRSPAGTRHPLLGRHLSPADAAGLHFWEAEVRIDSVPAAQHQVRGVSVVPAGMMLELLLAAAAEAFGDGPCQLTEVELLRPCVVEEGEPRLVQVRLTEAGPGQGTGAIYSRPAGDRAAAAGWVLNARCRVASDERQRGVA